MADARGAGDDNEATGLRAGAGFDIGAPAEPNRAAPEGWAETGDLRVAGDAMRPNRPAATGAATRAGAAMGGLRAATGRRSVS